MGQELECRVQLGGRSFAGKAYLESDHLLFRGEQRLKIPLGEVWSVTAEAGVLKLEFNGGPALFNLGPAAEKWAHKILHPPTCAAKLGIKPGLTVRLAGEFDPEFLAEIAALPTGGGKADLVFLSAPARQALAQIPKLRAALTPKGALWIVYPKGVPQIREIEVIQAARAAGLKDVKVASFSRSHTALRFVRPT